MKIEGKEFNTIWFNETNQNVQIIDQTKLPHKFIIKDLNNVEDAINAIKVMEVRGAPLIGATAAYGLVLAMKKNNDFEYLEKCSKNLINSRPTAINLEWAVNRMNNKLLSCEPANLFNTALDEAKKILEKHPKEVQDYKNGKDKLMGFFVGLIMKQTQGRANPKTLNEVLKKLLKGE